jgi:CheY-like chemotaxis protein
MVIDDDVQLVETVKTLLESVGYQVSYAYQPEKGMELARETKPDLILLDVMFAGPPGPDGIELSRRFHQDPDLKGIPIIILTGVRKETICLPRLKRSLGHGVRRKQVPGSQPAQVGAPLGRPGT